MARAIFDHTRKALEAHAKQSDTRYHLRSEVRLVKVRLWETSSSWAEYEAPVLK
jgi:6-pyruvoyltetrahydropterin/6-carboxytetrahydropterin synthase